MPSNKDLQAAITAAAGRLGVPADLSGNNGALAETLKGLNALAAELSPPSYEEAEAPAKVDEEAEAPAKVEPVEYVVALGRAITSRRGVLGEGSKVSARDFANVESFNLHVARNFVVESK